MNNSLVSITSDQQLVKTIHEIDKVVEVYVNPNDGSVQEVIYLSGDRIRVYDHSIEEYSKRAPFEFNPYMVN